MNSKILNDGNFSCSCFLELFDKKISIAFPSDFKVIDKNIVNKFPLGINPQVSYGNNDNLILSLHYTEHTLPNGVICNFCEVIEALLRKNKSIEFQQRYVSGNKFHEICVLEFEQCNFYETLFFTIIHRKVLIGYFSFCSDTYKSNYEIMEKIIESIK